MDPPRQKESILLRDEPGWITFSIDGRFAYPSTGDVIDVKTRKILTGLTDEKGATVQSEKLLEIDFLNNKPIRTGNQFGSEPLLSKAERWRYSSNRGNTGECHAQYYRKGDAATHSNVCFIDTHPHLNGEHEKFIDVMHFTQAGRQEAAENVFAGIKPILERDLSNSPSGKAL